MKVLPRCTSTLVHLVSLIQALAAAHAAGFLFLPRTTSPWFISIVSGRLASTTGKPSSLFPYLTSSPPGVLWQSWDYRVWPTSLATGCGNLFEPVSQRITSRPYFGRIVLRCIV